MVGNKEYSYIMGEDFACLVKMSNGTSVTVYESNPNFAEFVSLISEGKFEEALILGDTKAALNNYFAKGTSSKGIEFRVSDVVEYKANGGDWVEFHNALSNRIIDMAKKQLGVEPLINFMNNLLSNPSKQSVDELYLFLEKSSLPITDDGCFIAYKKVRSDYKDIYSGKFDHSIGNVISMPRNEVDDIRTNCCSVGFHFCSKGYLPHYGASSETDRVVLVKINPADVVSIPVDYNNAKGRCCKYEVVGELNNWKGLSDKDYTESPVVMSDDPHMGWDDHDFIEDDFIEDDLAANSNEDFEGEWEAVFQDINKEYFFSYKDNTWKNLATADWIDRQDLADEFNTSVGMLEYIEEQLT